jgi:hypothetical protein
VVGDADLMLIQDFVQVKDRTAANLELSIAA